MTANRRALRSKAARAVLEENSSAGVVDLTSPQSENRNNSEILEECFDGSNLDHVSNLIADLETEMERHWKKLRDSVIAGNQALQEDFAFKMMLIPRAIRNMSIKQLNDKYDCDLISIIESQDVSSNEVDGHKERVLQRDAFAGNKRGRVQQQNPFETPARTINLKPPATAPRTVKKGEVAYSKNGSPLEKSEIGEMTATITEKPRSYGPAVFEYNVGNGEYIQLEKPEDMDVLDESSKDKAMNYIIGTYEQLHNFVQNAKH